MRNALQLAGLQTESVDYLNLHATATKINDRMESRAVFNVFADAVLCSGTKGITGHTSIWATNSIRFYKELFHHSATITLALLPPKPKELLIAMCMFCLLTGSLTT
jgi:3-oxoacyl-[acyl-carrier-protein] synthase III